MAGQQKNPNNYERKLLPPINGGGITVEVTYNRKYAVEPIFLTDDQKTDAEELTPQPFPIDTLLVCFLVTKSGSDDIEYNYNPPLEIKITYPDTAWKDAIKRGFHHPRLAYLGRKGDLWVGDWIEFTKEITAIIPPDMCGDSEGKIILSVEELPDPLIGGC